MLEIKPYNRTLAVEYARKYAFDYNANYMNFNGFGGDCTNFVSQCVFAGAGVMNYTRTFGWYYISSFDRAPAWSGVAAFYDFFTDNPVFLKNNGGTGPFAVGTPDTDGAEIGDVIQLADESGKFYHSTLITDVNNQEIYVTSHSVDSRDRPLSSYTYHSLRMLHIQGVKIYARNG